MKLTGRFIPIFKKVRYRAGDSRIKQTPTPLHTHADKTDHFVSGCSESKYFIQMRKQMTFSQFPKLSAINCQLRNFNGCL